MILEEIKNIDSSKKELKKFAVTIGIVLLIISSVLFYKLNDLYKYFTVIAVILFILGFTFPVLLKPVHKVWMGISVLLGWFSTRLILSLLFYLVITPIKLIAKISGKEFLELKVQKERNSYWHYREKKEFSPKDSENQF
jgi:hypothetical protein